MFEVERNSPIEAAVLTEFFSRCGWQEPEGAAKMEWALAASEEWVICRLDGQLIGFGRSCRLDPVKRVVFDVLVDPRFEDSGLKAAIVHLLTENAGSLEDVSVFGELPRGRFGPAPPSKGATGPGCPPTAGPGTYLGRRHSTPGGSD